MDNIKLAVNNEKPYLELVRSFRREDYYRSRSFNRQIAYRYLFRLKDGNLVEASAYQHYLDNTPVDLSIDISSMVGCPMKCQFCGSGGISYKRPLLINEMIAQVSTLVSLHDESFPRITCSFQGIGEPSLIPKSIIETGKKLMELDARYEISISTIGEKLNAFSIWRESEIYIDNLQLSCSGTTRVQIQTVMPRTPSITQLVEELVLCQDSPNINKVKMNYVLMNGFNDSELDVKRIIELLRNTGVTVKVSSLNFTSSSNKHNLNQVNIRRAIQIRDQLNKNNIDSYVYGAFSSIDVSCGQLVYAEVID